MRRRNGRDRPRGEPDRVAAGYGFDPIVSKNSASTRFPVLAESQGRAPRCAPEPCFCRIGHTARPDTLPARVLGLHHGQGRCSGDRAHRSAVDAYGGAADVVCEWAGEIGDGGRDFGGACETLDVVRDQFAGG